MSASQQSAERGRGNRQALAMRIPAAAGAVDGSSSPPLPLFDPQQHVARRRQHNKRDGEQDQARARPARRCKDRRPLR